MASNNVARQRKLIHSDNENPRSKPRRKSGGRSTQTNLKFSFACLLVSVTLLVLLFVYYTDSVLPLIDDIANRFGYNEKRYAVVLDAGSTGSRVLAYEFHLGYVNGRPALDRELFKEVKPGLSSYADRPKVGAERLVELFQLAREFVPASAWRTTPIVLKATAGLRLLPAQQADQLLAAVREVIGASGFLVADDAVEIMDGTDEGIFSWFTVNFLLRALGGPNSVAALDLGGASTQVTFVPLDPRKTPGNKEYMHSVQGASATDTINVFTHSYLGLGLMAVRRAVFSQGQAANETQLVSECVNPIVRNKHWTYALVEYSVSGAENKNAVVDFERCGNAIRKTVLPLIVPKPVTLKQSQIATFSYYFERAIETGLIDLNGGIVSVNDIWLKAREVCDTPNTDQPFMCLDITYIAVLLEEGFGLPRDTKLKIFKKIDGHEISWALGCAYNLLQKQLQKAA